jgi:hypothetical protein
MVEMKRVFKNYFDELRRRLREKLPLKRKHHTKLVAVVDAQFARLDTEVARLSAELARVRIDEFNLRVDAVSDHLLALPSLATTVPITAKIPVQAAGATEICLFVSFAPEPKLKPHVIDHVRALSTQGIAVILIVNTAHSSDQFFLEPDFAACLAACLIRANRGFDFAAWAHAYSMLENVQTISRLYLINDSIVGPLQPEPFANLLTRIRSSNSDLIGLTENSMPQPHLQSYFLAINERLLHSAAFAGLMRGIVNMPTKEGVIAQYETQITRFLCAQGFKCEALFPRLTHALDDKFLSNDTINKWAQLIDSGFPFIKAQVLDAIRQSPEAARLIPARYLNSAAQNERRTSVVL